jgi:hypothetical protein
VDPLLGGDQAFDALVAELKRRGMRLILDGVFNHCGRGFWAFHHLLENGPASPYADWFITEHWPLKPYPEPGEPCGYPQLVVLSGAAEVQPRQPCGAGAPAGGGAPLDRAGYRSGPIRSLSQ